jgi:hypothetical protein
MTVDEQYRRVRRTLEEKLGVEEASYLMDRPVGGWSELVTNHTLDLKFELLDHRFESLGHRFDAIEHRFDALDHRFEAVESRVLAEMERRFRLQTWSLITALIAAVGVLGALLR